MGATKHPLIWSDRVRTPTHALMVETIIKIAVLGRLVGEKTFPKSSAIIG